MNKTTTPALLRVRDVMSKTGLPKSTLYLMIKQERFPAPVKLSERSVAWPSDQIDHWVNNRIAGIAA